MVHVRITFASGARREYQVDGETPVIDFLRSVAHTADGQVKKFEVLL